MITVICNECGFIYSRKKSADLYKIGTIKDFGYVWSDRLKNILVCNQNNSLRAIAKEMECDPKTVVKYAAKLGCSNYIMSTMKIYSKSNKLTSDDKGSEYRVCIEELIRNNPDISISKIKQLKYKEYMWLYKNDKTWLNSVSPVNIKPTNKGNKVDWNKRDVEIVKLLQMTYHYVKNIEPGKRITKTLLGRMCGKLSYIEKKLNKMPLSMRYLETVEEYQIRRVNAVCEELRNRGDKLVEWKIKKLATLKDNISDKVLGVIKVWLES